jgi:hypothetical protein
MVWSRVSTRASSDKWSGHDLHSTDRADGYFQILDDDRWKTVGWFHGLVTLFAGPNSDESNLRTTR